MRRAIVLSDLQRAELYQGLGRALSAGLDADTTLAALEGTCDGALDPALARARRAVAKGRALIATLDGNGLLGGLDRALLDAAEQTGSIGPACIALADRYQRAAVRWRQMKGRLMLPGAVFVIGVLVLPLPALMRGEVDVTGYVVRTAVMLGLLAILAKLFSATVRGWRAAGTPGWLTRLARVLPVAGPMSRLHQRADACEHLALALRSGLPAVEALAAMRRAEGNPVRRDALADAGARLAGGAPVAASLERAGLLGAAHHAIASAGEAAGRLESSLQRIGDALHDELDGRYDTLARWLPVAVYALVAGFVGAGLLL